MSANRRRGEISAELDGKQVRLCLTLGALAELETAYAADDLGMLVERFSSGRFSALDMIRIIGAGLRGAGAEMTDENVGKMQSSGGAAGFAAIVADLLSTTFWRATPMDEPDNPQMPQQVQWRFPGTTSCRLALACCGFHQRHSGR